MPMGEPTNRKIPMDQMMPQMQSPQGTQPEDAPVDDGSYTIEIEVGADGTIKVGVEPAGEMQEAPEGQEDEQYQTVQNIDECLRLVKQIYAGAGQMNESTNDKAAMQSGYRG